MIELLFFFTACIITPMYEDVYCDIEIFIIESQNEMKHIWYQETGNVTAKDNTIKGMHVYLPKYEKRIIWIWEGHHGDYTFLGCTVLWHELLHAQGFDHDTMQRCSWRP